MDEYDYYKTQYENICTAKTLLESQLYELNICIKEIINLTNKNYKILGLDKDKKENKLIVYQYDKPFDVFILKPILNIELKLFAYQKEKNIIYIDDIQSSYYNYGLGSVAMKYFLAICKKKNIKKVEGSISSVDWDHIDRIHRFYTKHGFSVYLNHHKKTGWIEKKLLP